MTITNAQIGMTKLYTYTVTNHQLIQNGGLMVTITAEILLVVVIGLGAIPLMKVSHGLTAKIYMINLHPMLTEVMLV